MNTKMISLSDMKVDGSYQRIPDEKRIEKIARNWDDRKANLVHVSHRADGYYVIDGNHTRLAYEKVGGKQLLCRVYDDLTVEEEAKLFYELNSSQKKPRYGELLRSKVAAGCELETTYIHALEEAGLSYSYNGFGAGKIRCHAALISIYKTTTYSLMLRSLKVAKQAADGRDVFFQIGYFPGICSLVVTHPELDDIRLINAIKRTTSSQIKEISDKYRRSAISGSSSTTRDFRNAYIDIYNKGLRQKSKKIKED